MAKFGMVPKHSFLQDVSSCMFAKLPDKFYDRVEDGSIKLKKSQNVEFCKEGLLLDGQDSPVETDLVIFATGFRGDAKLREIFRSPKFSECIVGHDRASAPLYRSVSPRTRRLRGCAETNSASKLVLN